MGEVNSSHRKWRVFEDITHGWWGIEIDGDIDADPVLYPKKMNREYLDGIVEAYNSALASHTSALAEKDARIAELEAALDSIRVYGSDTLSGRVDGPADKDWYRDGVREMRNRARAALKEKADA